MVILEEQSSRKNLNINVENVMNKKFKFFIKIKMIYTMKIYLSKKFFVFQF